MDFWRHTWNLEDWSKDPTFLYNLRNFGFKDVQHGELDESHFVVIDEHHKYYPGIVWGGDNAASLNNNSFTLSILDNAEYWGTNTNTGGQITDYNNFVFHTQNGGYQNCIWEGSYVPDGQDHQPTPLRTFFIPLKDNGFLLNFRKNSTGYTSSEDFDPDGWNYGQTPRFITNALSYNRGYGVLCKTIIGLPPTSNNNNTSYTYIILSKVVNGGSGNVFQLNTGNGINQTLNLHESLSYGDFGHVDFKNNICSLIKYPYEGGFIDNLYIMTTSPARFGDDVACFSIDGHNFMKVLENIVVELPSTE